ncbi:hypothetical protein MJ669_000687 [Cronobacter sakazakii]|nr:hypothetical protein [Cronobacter sakazakii]EMA8637598.1 hypothetical protein [Cronobacter malonaticus]
MNKQAWLEAALDLIETMPRDEFLSALHDCGILDADLKEVTARSTYPLVGAAASQINPNEGQVWKSENFRMDDEFLTCFPKLSNSAPQGALCFVAAA